MVISKYPSQSQVKSSQRYLLQQDKYHTYNNIRGWNPFGFICLMNYQHSSYRKWPHFGDNNVSTSASTWAEQSLKGTAHKIYINERSFSNSYPGGRCQSELQQCFVSEMNSRQCDVSSRLWKQIWFKYIINVFIQTPHTIAFRQTKAVHCQYHNKWRPSIAIIISSHWIIQYDAANIPPPGIQYCSIFFILRDEKYLYLAHLGLYTSLRFYKYFHMHVTECYSHDPVDWFNIRALPY